MSIISSEKASLQKNTAWMLAGRLARVVVQGMYFVLLARSLAVSQYGAFVAVTALAGLLSPFATLGTGNLLVKRVSRSHSSFQQSWGLALSTTVLFGLMLCLVGAFASHFGLPDSVSLEIVVPILLAELIFARIIDVAGQAYMAFEKLQSAAVLLLSLSVSRLFAAGLLMSLFTHPSASLWAELYLFSTAGPAIIAVLAVNHQIATPILSLIHGSRDFIEGVYFSISLSAQTIYNDIDKTMLASLSGLTAAGLYGAAYRIIDVACTPLGALLSASYSRFFRHGAGGLQGAVSFGNKLLPKTIAFGVACSLALIIIAPLLPNVLGRQYNEAAGAIRWLAPIVLLRCVHYIGADAMSGGDYQRLRSMIQVLVAIVNVGLNLLILPRYSWKGAVATSLACDALLLVLIWATIVRLAGKASSQSVSLSMAG